MRHWVVLRLRTIWDHIVELRTNSLKECDSIVDHGKLFLNRVKKNPPKAFPDMVDDGKIFFAGLEKIV